jgi:hypothetical protein
MKVPRWLRPWLPRTFGAPIERADPLARPLREFVYLDEGSLRSLLSSQKGEVTDTTSEQSVAAHQAELAGTAGFNTAMLAKGDLTSRYQTSNSNTLQTSRKATVQSWFRELHSLPDLRLIEPQSDVPAVADVNKLFAIDNRSIVTPASELRRGDLVEFRVRLAADPVFRFGTLMTEFSGLADDHPILFAANNAFAFLAEMEPVNRILQRLLAGLIPIRARAVDYMAISIGGTEHIAHRDALTCLELETQPLEIVGVTEHLAYWRDIRRVLFSEGEFTMLCRIGRSGLQSTWTPVKLAELFLPFAPDLVEQIDTASRSSLENQGGTSVNTNDLLLGEALRSYKEALLIAGDKQLSEDQQLSVEGAIAALQARSGSVSGQRSAFTALYDLLSNLVEAKIDASQDLKLREDARTSSGLPLFPSLSQGMATIVGGAPASPDAQAPRLLDVEVVAIYW